MYSSVFIVFIMATLYPYSAIENYVEGIDVNTDQILVPQDLWSQWTSMDNTDVLFLRLTCEEKEVFVTVGGYHNDKTVAVAFFCPQWVFHQIEEFSQIQYELIDELPPAATKIILKPLDNEIYHSNIEEQVSAYLAKWQSLKVGTTITIPLEELGGYPVDIYVESLEPAEWCLLRDELVLEMAEPIENVTEWSRKRTREEDNQNVIVKNEPVQNVNEAFDMSDEMPSQKGFKPFSGAGNKLGSA